MLTLDEVKEGSYVHVHKHRRDRRGVWAKFDLVLANLTEKDSGFFSHFHKVLNKPEMYIKAKSHAFPAPVPPYQHIQLCDVILALQNERKMTFVSLCVTLTSMTAKYLQSVLS